MTLRPVVLLSILSLALSGPSLKAQTVPSTINYQGRLTDNTPAQTPLTATVPMSFAIYDAVSGGTQVWLEPASGTIPVSVTGGIFTVQLGANGVPLPNNIFINSPDRWLEITAGGDILAPRQKLTATGYANLAFYTNTASLALHANISDIALDSNTLVGHGPGYFLPATGTAADSVKLGGVTASGWQKALQTPACASGFLTTINADGTTVCASPSLTETDPKVGALTTSRIPYWNGATLANGAMVDTGFAVGLGVPYPITQFQVANLYPTHVGTDAAGDTPWAIAVQGRYAYVASRNANLLIVYDLYTPYAPLQVGFQTTDTWPDAIAVQGRYAYVANASANTLQIFDISKPAAPVVVGSVGTDNWPDDVYIQGRYAYVATNSSGTLQVFDIADPTAPALAGTLSLGGSPWSVRVSGHYAYVTCQSTGLLQVVDVANPAAPVAVGSVSTGGTNPLGLEVQGRYAYALNFGTNELKVIDLMNPAAPAVVGTVSTAGFPRTVRAQGRFLYVGSQAPGQLQIFDISSPAAPALVGATSQGLFALAVQGRYAYGINANDNLIHSYDLGGAYLQQLEAGGIETGTLATRGNAAIAGDAEVRGGLYVGPGGVYTSGSLATAGTVRIAGGSPGAGKVLTSDAKGNGSWQAATYSGILPIANGGTGSGTQNFVDLTTAQSVGGVKTFTSTITGSVSGSAASFTGSLAGDVTGTQAATTVARLQGRTMAATAPGAGQAVVWNGSQWAPGVDGGTGASPLGILVTMTGHTGASPWNSPTSSTQGTLTGLTSALLPVNCRPSFQIWSYANAVITWNLYSVLPSPVSTTWTQGAVLLSCSTAGAAGSTCNATAGGSLAPGTIVSLTSGGGLPPGGGGFMMDFSCLP